jgi:hypothetical protein
VSRPRVPNIIEKKKTARGSDDFEYRSSPRRFFAGREAFGLALFLVTGVQEPSPQGATRLSGLFHVIFRFFFGERCGVRGN